jgi:benzoate-CoA ligase family protein
MSGADLANASLIVDRNIEAGRAGNIAYVSQHGSLTYEQLRLQINRMGGLLRELGVRREQRVLLVLDDTIAFPVAFLGALRIGAVPVPVSVRETELNFRHFVEDSYAEIVICDADILPALKAALAGHELRFLARGAGAGAIELDGALAAQEDELTPVPVHPEDMAFWLYTSGSTGRPKGVVHMHASMEVTGETFGRHVLGMQEDDRVFSTTKLYHSYGLGNSLSYPLRFGARAVLLDRAPTPERLLQTLREQRPTVYCSVPALYRQLVSHPDVGDAFDSVRLCISAAEPLPVRTFEQWRERFGLEIADGIGATEMFVSYCSNRPGDVVAGTTGRAVPGYELRLTGDAGEELEGPALGTLEVRGGSRAAYYWHHRERTARSMRGEWFVTGDRFRRNQDGTYVYIGRTDDMLRVGGLWVSPIDMERVLLEHPAVSGAGVVGVSIDGYTRVAAFVKCSAEATADDQLSSSLRSWCKERMREYEYPHVIRFVEGLPQTLNGKPQRFKLREIIEREFPPAAEEACPPDAAGGAGPGVRPLNGTRPAHSALTARPTAGLLGGDGERSLARRLAEMGEGDREEAVMELVLNEISAVLGGVAVTTIDRGSAFEELGFDSLSAVELSVRLANATGLSLPSTVIFDHPTPVAVAALLRSRADGSEPSRTQLDQAGDGAAHAAVADEDPYLSRALEAVSRPADPPRMPSAPLDVRVKTSPLLHVLLPGRLAVGRAERQGRGVWEQSAVAREDAVAALETIVAGTSRAGELGELARMHVIDRSIDRAIFWQHPWSAKLDGPSAKRLGDALSSDRGVLLSACHVGPYYRLQCAPAFNGRVTYTVPGPWFFEPPTPNYWGRRLARWRKGMKSRPVPARGSFRLIQCLLDRGDSVFLFFDLPGPRETSFLGKPAMLAEGSAQLAVRADALVVPVRARRSGHRVWVDAGEALDPREFAGVEDLHAALARLHEAWILENPSTMEDPRTIGWEHGASAEAWVQP